MKSRMPEIVEPKQLVQSRVLVKRARLTVKRGAARPNGKSGQEGDELIQADVAEEMAFKEGREMSDMGPKKLILRMGVQSNGA